MNKCWPNLSDLIYRINGLVPKKACDYFISTLENNIKLATSEASLKYGGEHHGKDVRDDFASLALHLFLDNKEIMFMLYVY